METQLSIKTDSNRKDEDAFAVITNEGLTSSTEVLANSKDLSDIIESNENGEGKNKEKDGERNERKNKEKNKEGEKVGELSSPNSPFISPEVSIPLILGKEVRGLEKLDGVASESGSRRSSGSRETYAVLRFCPSDLHTVVSILGRHNQNEKDGKKISFLYAHVSHDSKLAIETMKVDEQVFPTVRSEVNPPATPESHSSPSTPKTRIEKDPLERSQPYISMPKLFDQMGTLSMKEKEYEKGYEKEGKKGKIRNPYFQNDYIMKKGEIIKKRINDNIHVLFVDNRTGGLLNQTMVIGSYQHLSDLMMFDESFFYQVKSNNKLRWLFYDTTIRVIVASYPKLDVKKIGEFFSLICHFIIGKACGTHYYPHIDPIFKVRFPERHGIDTEYGFNTMDFITGVSDLMSYSIPK